MGRGGQCGLDTAPESSRRKEQGPLTNPGRFACSLTRSEVPERVAMLLTGHKRHAIFGRSNIIHEQELLNAGNQLVAYLEPAAPAAISPVSLNGLIMSPALS